MGGDGAAEQVAPLGLHAASAPQRERAGLSAPVLLCASVC